MAGGRGRGTDIDSRGENRTLFFKRACVFFFRNYANTIPAVYGAVIDLLMRTAIVPRSVVCSQTAERLRVEAVVQNQNADRRPHRTEPPSSNVSRPPAALVGLNGGRWLSACFFTGNSRRHLAARPCNPHSSTFGFLLLGLIRPTVETQLHV